MSWNQNHRNNDDRNNESPPYSRIFVVCSKDLDEQTLKNSFEEFGEIENLYMPKDRNTGGPRGVAYVKYSKTSAAAAAIEALNQKTIGNCNKALKVMIASKKDDVNDNSSNIVYDRLFVKISKTSTEEEMKEYFSKFGKVEKVLLLKEKSTNENKGLAFVQFRTFFEAATAFEECDKKYKAVFAEPKQELKRGRDDRHSNYNDNFNSFNAHTPKDYYPDYYNDMSQHRNMLSMNVPPMNPLMNSTAPLIKTPGQNYKALIATCTPILAQNHLIKLFDIVPGMQNFQYFDDKFNGFCRVLVTYEDERAAAHAFDKLNNYEFPSGELVTVKPNNPLSKAADDLTSILSSFKSAVDNGSPDLMHLADAIAKASTLIKAATTGGICSSSSIGISSKTMDSQMHDPTLCNVPLPPSKPLARPNSVIAKRCFIVCKPRPPPQHMLQDVFCRFGDLIDILVFPNKTFAFARYASEKAAQNAIDTLHGAVVGGMSTLKVMEADEPKQKDRDPKTNEDELMEHDGERKRAKIDKD